MSVAKFLGQRFDELDHWLQTGKFGLTNQDREKLLSVAKCGSISDQISATAILNAIIQTVDKRGRRGEQEEKQTEALTTNIETLLGETWKAAIRHATHKPSLRRMEQDFPDIRVGTFTKPQESHHGADFIVAVASSHAVRIAVFQAKKARLTKDFYGIDWKSVVASEEGKSTDLARNRNPLFIDLVEQTSLLGSSNFSEAKLIKAMQAGKRSPHFQLDSLLRSFWRPGKLKITRSDLSNTEQWCFYSAYYPPENQGDERLARLPKASSLKTIASRIIESIARANAPTPKEIVRRVLNRGEKRKFSLGGDVGLGRVDPFLFEVLVTLIRDKGDYGICIPTENALEFVQRLCLEMPGIRLIVAKRGEAIGYNLLTQLQSFADYKLTKSRQAEIAITVNEVANKIDHLQLAGRGGSKKGAIGQQPATQQPSSSKHASPPSKAKIDEATAGQSKQKEVKQGSDVPKFR